MCSDEQGGIMLGMSELDRFRAPQVDSETLNFFLEKLLQSVESFGTGFRVLGFEIWVFGTGSWVFGTQCWVLGSAVGEIPTWCNPPPGP